MGLDALAQGDLAGAENLKRRRRGNGKPSVGALNPTGALDNLGGQHPGFAQHLQPNARAHDVHDRIHRAHLMEVHRLGGQAVNFALGGRDPLKNGDGFFLDPIGERARGDELLDLREIALRRKLRVES